jgi:hypothetical protein
MRVWYVAERVMGVLHGEDGRRGRGADGQGVAGRMVVVRGGRAGRKGEVASVCLCAAVRFCSRLVWGGDEGLVVRYSCQCDFTLTESTRLMHFCVVLFISIQSAIISQSVRVYRIIIIVLVLDPS